MRKIISLLIIGLLFPIAMYADAVEIDGIYYNLVEKANEAEVTEAPDGYTGDIVIPESVEYNGVKYNVVSIGNHAFSSVTSDGPTSVQLPEGITSIGVSAFNYCKKLQSIIIPNSVTEIQGGAFRKCESLNSVTIGTGLVTIDQYVFKGCISLSSIIIPDNVGSIYIGAFEDCTNLTTVTFGIGLNFIDSGILKGCTALTDIYCYASTLPLTDINAFEDSYPDHTTLHVPAASLEAYEAEIPWNEFKDIVPISDTRIVSIVKGPDGSTIYTLDGRKVNTQQKGINIIRFSNGETKKILNK